MGCATQGNTPINTIGGGLIGGIGGGIAGSQIGGGSGKVVATIAGAILGVALGSYIGSYMDRADLARSNQVLEKQPTGVSSSWVNPDTGNQYNMTPVRTYEKNNTYCREFITEALINNEIQTIYGTACRQPDGSWKVIDQKYSELQPRTRELQPRTRELQPRRNSS